VIVELKFDLDKCWLIMRPTMYSFQPFSLLQDPIVTRHTRRCVRPRFDKRGDVYEVDPMTNLPMIVTEVMNERIVSPFAKSYRAPNLSSEHWLKQETYHILNDHLEGCIIQIFSIMTAVGIKTTYNLQYTADPRKIWKRMIVSYHVSEGRPFNAHIVREFDFE